MNESNVLLSIAEVAVALLGFAAIVSVFRQRDTWRPDGRFWAMVGAGAGTLIFSLLPLPFLFGSIAAISTWQTCCTLLGFYALGYCGLLISSFRRDQAAGAAPNPPIFVGIFVGSALSSLFLFSSAIGWLDGPHFWSYLVGLIWFQVVTVIIFIRLLVVWLR